MNAIIQEKQGQLFDEMGAFWAFNTEQFEERKKEGIIYVRITSLGGIICPKENASKLIDELSRIHIECAKIDIAKNGIEKIILRELYNHEAFYTNEIEDTLSSLKIYNVSKEQVYQVFLEERRKLEN